MLTMMAKIVVLFLMNVIWYKYYEVEEEQYGESRVAKYIGLDQILSRDHLPNFLFCENVRYDSKLKKLCSQLLWLNQYLMNHLVV